MIHELRLHEDPFQKIKARTKTIEMRLYDEKRKRIKIGDIIEFTNRVSGETIKTEVINLYLFNNFEELYNNLDSVSIGYCENEKPDPRDMEKYYSKEEQCQYGVVGIEIKLI